MKILVIGNGAREHAIGWTLFNGPSNHDIYVAPGNAGTHQFATNIEIDSLFEGNDLFTSITRAKSIKISFLFSLCNPV